MMYYPQSNMINMNTGMGLSMPTFNGNNSGMVPIGYGGYNGVQPGGYFNGMYNNFNPYEVKKQQEAQLLAQKEAERKQTEIYQMIHKSVCMSEGREATFEELDAFRFKKYNGHDLSGFTPEQIQM